MELPDPRTEEGRQALESLLLTQSYVGGPEPSQADTTVYNRLGGVVPAGGEVGALARWLGNMNSYEAGERKTFPVSEVALTMAVTQEVVSKS